jgi:hypothetical protein
MESSGWIAVRCVFRLNSDSTQLYEERVTLWQADELETAIVRAEAEASDYANQVDAEFLGLAQAYALADPLQDGAEVFSLLRASSLEPDDYLDRFFDTGTERQDTG